MERMTATRRTLRVAHALWMGWAMTGLAFAAKPTPPLELPHGARVGLVSVLDAEVTHYHAAPQLTGTSVKTQPVSWRVDLMFVDALQAALGALGVVPLALPPGDALRGLREQCFLDANLTKPLTKECAAPYSELARAQHLDAIIVLGPGLNNAAHAEATRRKELPEYLRGFCVLTDGKPGAGAPTLLNLTELLLIANTPQGAALAAREWGGAVSSVWIGYTPAADPRQLSDSQVEQLQPQFAGLLRGQAQRLLTHLGGPH
jgi:hypothetical protein